MSPLNDWKYRYGKISIPKNIEAQFLKIEAYIKIEINRISIIAV